MISIKRYLSGGSRTEEALRRVVEVLLSALQMHAVEGDDEEAILFRSTLSSLAKRFSAAITPEEMLVIAGALASSIKDYGERTTRFVRAHGAEYQQMVATLMQTIASVTQASDRTVTRLHDIEKQLERASVIEDVRALRHKLNQCLESIQEEIHEQERNDAAKELEQALQASHARLSESLTSSASTEDPVTGLPGRAAAEEALAEAGHKKNEHFAVAVVANRVQVINSRFGYSVGDRVLRHVSEAYRNALSADDLLFRWQGPSFLAILRRPSNIEEVRKEIARIASSRAEELVEIGNRTVLLPVSASWTVFPMSASTRLLVARLDQFVASQSPAD